MLQKAVVQLLRERGWDVVSEGRVVTADREDCVVVLGFLEPGDATEFLERVEDSPATVCGIFLHPLRQDEVDRLEAAGIACFDRDAIEDVVVAALLKREVGSSAFLRVLEGATDAGGPGC